MKRLLSKADILLILGALRRAFARSDIHKAIKARHRVEHSDPKKPKCRKWSWCAECGQVVPEWSTDVDHKIPVTPFDKFQYEMTPEEILYGIWDQDDFFLQNLCSTCHSTKTSLERELRKRAKNERKKL